MALSYLIERNVNFNQTIFEENEANRWKFLEELDPDLSPLGILLMSPMPVLILTSSYILFVCFIGPFLMRNREPFQLKSLIRAYNLLMVFIAGLLVVRMYQAVDSLSTMTDCSKTFSFLDDSATKTYRMANFIMMVRLTEYFDTIFFTLRKKQNQVTFLHVFHHAFVPMYAYWVLRTAPVRFNVFIIIINSFIHVLMYFYYYIATFQQPRDTSIDGNRKKPKQSFMMLIITKLLMFKKYMTQMQILQFVLLGLYAIWAGLQPNHCNIPWTYIIANLLLALGFLSLFLHFYIRSYNSAAAAKQSRSKKD